MVRSRLLLVGLLALAPASAAAQDLDEIEKRGTLRVLAVVAPDDEFLTDQPGRGLDRELLEAFAQLKQLRLLVVSVDAWDGLVPALLKGRGDVIAGRFTVTEARQKQIDFTPEVFPTRSVVVTRRPHRVVATLLELRSERVGTVKGTSLADAVTAAGVPLASVDDGIATGRRPEALPSGRVTAVVLGRRGRAHGLAQRGHELERRRLRADQDRDRRPRVLRERQVDTLVLRADTADATQVHVGHDAHDRPPRRRIVA